MNPILTSSDKLFIRRSRLKMPSCLIAKELGCSKSVVQKYLKLSGLTPPKEIIQRFRSAAMRGRTTFNKRQDKFILANYINLPVKTIAARIGKSYTGVMCRVRQLGLVIPHELRQARKEIGMYRKGHTPANKGKMMPIRIYKKCRPTMFKKGNLPVNTKFDGSIVIRHNHKERGDKPYKWIRLAKGKWEMLHVNIWRKQFGLVPKGHIIIFKNGDTMNCSIDNLQCISRVEHAANTRNKDGYIAMKLAHKKGKGVIDRELYQQMLSNPTMLNLKREQLKLNKVIYDTQTNS